MTTFKDIRWETLDNGEQTTIGYVGNIPLFEFFRYRFIPQEPLPYKVINRVPGSRKYVYCKDPSDCKDTAQRIHQKFLREIIEDEADNVRQGPGGVEDPL